MPNINGKNKAPAIWVSHQTAQVKRVAGRHFLFNGSHLTEGAAP